MKQVLAVSLRLALPVFALLALSSASLFAAEPAGPYRLQPGDEIAVGVSPQKGFDAAGILLPDGFIYLKNVGKLKAAGLTIDELTELVRKALEVDLVEPRVIVSLVKTAPPPNEKPVRQGQITVVGAVAKTGPMALEQGLRVRKAIDLAGGVLKDADLKAIVIFHADLTRTIVDLSTDERIGDPRHNRTLQDGDSVEVRLLPARVDRPVRIGGAVINPGLYELKPGMTLEDLIVTAGKLNSLADIERIDFRREGMLPERVNLVERQKLGLGGKLTLQPGDEFFVPEQRDRLILIGAVPRPGPQALKPGTRLVDFFLHGGPELAGALNTATAELEQVELIRPGQVSRKLNLRQALKQMGHRDNIELSAGDVLFLPPKKAARRGPLEYLSQLGPLGFLFGLL